MPSAVHVMREMPTTGSGKVLKTALRAEYAPHTAPTGKSGSQASSNLSGTSLDGVARRVAALCGGAPTSVIRAEGNAGGGLPSCVALITTADSALSDVSAEEKPTCALQPVLRLLL